MVKYPVLGLVIAIACSLLCFKIEYATCASYILTEDLNPEPHVDLNKPVYAEATHEDLDMDSIADCCSNSTCIYDMVVDALQGSPEFDDIKTLVLFTSGGPRYFIPINVQVLWNEIINGEPMNQSYNTSYVWGATPAKAVFGPIQDLFPTPSMYSLILALLSLLEEVLTSEDFAIGSHQNENIHDRLQAERWTVVLDISHTCISISTENKLTTLNQTIQMYVKQALQLVSLPCIYVLAKVACESSQYLSYDYE